MDSETPQETGSRLTAILDAAIFAIINIDCNGTIEDFNPAAEKMFGYEAREVVGRNVSILMPEPYRSEHNANIQKYISTGEKKVIGIGRQAVACRRDGTEFPVYISISEVQLPERRIFTGMIEDISSRVDAELRVRELQDELVHVARVSAMGEMASALAHELNQPLTAITNYASAARRVLTTGGEGAHNSATDLILKAGKQSQRAGEIIRRLREFIERGKTERNWHDLRSTVEEAAQLGLVGSRSKNIEFRFNAADNLPDVMIDRIQIQQVLQNLVRNAVDALDDWTGKRLITVGIDRTKNACVEILVEDTGPGISSDIKHRLFQPFVTTKQNGMGIGLSVSKNIIESHGGQISVEEGEAGGARFRVVLPIQPNS